MTTSIRRKVRLALFGGHNSPKLYNALQIAYGLTGSWQRIVVIDPTGKADRYSDLGDYHTFGIHPQSTPERYSSVVNIVQYTPHDVIILDNFSAEWLALSSQLNDFNYQEVLRSHRALMDQIRFSCSHIICLVDTQSRLAYRDKDGNARLHFQNQVVQQDGFERYFTCVMRIDRKGAASTLKDLTGTLPIEKFYQVSSTLGAGLADFVSEGKPIVPEDLQQKINSCNSLEELYQLLLSKSIDDVELLAAFRKRRSELESARETQLTNEDFPF